MQVKEIEALRVKAGETLVIVMDRVWPTDCCVKLNQYLAERGIAALLLPPDTKLYVVEPQHASRS